jgi:long-chain acyl-CoA synthetase
MTLATHDAAPPDASRPATLGALVRQALRDHDGVAMRVPRDGGTVEWSYAALAREAAELARGLVALGIGPGDRVAVLATTRPEWTIADCAIAWAGAIVVPVYHTSSPEECAYILAHSEARAIVCETAAHVATVTEARGELPALEHVIAIDPGASNATSLADLRARAPEVPPEALDRRLDELEPDDPATIVYTSGTTGPPKGCVLTHRNVLATVDMYERRLDLGVPVLFLFLPLAHMLARITQLVGLDRGATLAFWSGEPARLLEDVTAAAPTHLPSVPRLFEKIHTRALAGVHDGPALRRRLFGWALGTGQAHRDAERTGTASPALHARHAVADRLVLSRVRTLFGGRLELALTGAAPIAPEVLRFFDACGVLVVEGYGLTETCAAATLNAPGAFRFGTVGRALPGAEVRVAADGEVLIRGPHVFAGYHRDPEATRQVLDGDWLRTGDLGELDDDGYLRITGRKKELIITSSGKNVAPANVESALRESRWISQAVVFGDNRPYLVALLTLDPEEAPALAGELGVPAELEAMARDPRVRERLQAEVDAANRRFARIEQVKRFLVLGRDLSQAAGELTPTLKVKRTVLEQRYGAEIAALYG